MPELPEVNTLALALDHHLTGDMFVEWQQYTVKLRRPLPGEEKVELLLNRPVKSVQRVAKSIFVDFGISEFLHVHLGMTGAFVLQSATVPRQKHEHLRVRLKSGKALSYVDSRRFGVVEIVPFPDILVCEPFSNSLTVGYLREKCSGSKQSIKALIMDQSVIAGIGNIYASEALLEAGILPFREAASLSEVEHKKLVSAIFRVIKKAVKAGSDSLQPEFRIDFQTTHFDIEVNAYGREAELCGKCRRGLIMNARIGGRSSFYCPVCQI